MKSTADKALESPAVLRVPATLTALLLCLSCNGGGQEAEQGPRRRTRSAPPNVIVILSDTHRLDHVSGFRPDVPDRTPKIAALMADGVTYTEARTPVPISAPAYASLLSGVTPAVHGLLNNQQNLVSRFPLLQERLKAAGYQTAAVVGNPFCSSGHGFGRGFDSFWDRVDGNGKEGAIITREAVRWLDSRDPAEPFFLFAAYMDAHTPYISDEIGPSLRLEVNGRWIRDELAENAHVEQRYDVLLQPGKNRIGLSFLEGGRRALPADAESPLYLKDLRLESGTVLDRSPAVVPIKGTPYERLDNRAVLTAVNPGDRPVEDALVFRCYRKYRYENIPSYYDAGVRSFDRAAGELLDSIRARGLYDDAIVVFVSDHGEMLGEHGAWGHVGHLWAESLRIPLVVKAPDLQAGKRDHAPLDLVDLHDLILDLTLGPDEERSRRRTARALEPMVGATYPPEAPRLQASAIRAGLKVIVAADGTELAFDLQTDPREQTDILDRRGDEPEIRALLSAARKELAAAASADLLDVDGLSDEERDRLHALGYLPE